MRRSKNWRRMPSKATTVALLAQDVRKAIQLLGTTDSLQTGTVEIQAQAEVALDELVTLARAYTLVAYVEQINGYKFT